MPFWQFFRKGWDGRSLLVRPSKINNSIWNILFVLGANEYLERLEYKIRKCLFFYVKIFWNNSVRPDLPKIAKLQDSFDCLYYLEYINSVLPWILHIFFPALTDYTALVHMSVWFSNDGWLFEICTSYLRTWCF